MSAAPYLLFLLLLLTACTPRQNGEYTPRLVSINIIDRDGLSETICNPDRLEKFDNIDFFGSTTLTRRCCCVYERDDEGIVQAYVTSYHENGQVRQYLEVANGRASGMYREWYGNGNIKVEAQVIGGTADITMAAEKTWLFDGTSKAWDDNGNLIAEIPYSKGDQQGIALYYHSNGALWKKSSL